MFWSHDCQAPTSFREESQVIPGAPKGRKKRPVRSSQRPAQSSISVRVTYFKTFVPCLCPYATHGKIGSLPHCSPLHRPAFSDLLPRIMKLPLSCHGDQSRINRYPSPHLVAVSSIGHGHILSSLPTLGPKNPMGWSRFRMTEEGK